MAGFPPRKIYSSPSIARCKCTFRHMRSMLQRPEKKTADRDSLLLPMPGTLPPDIGGTAARRAGKGAQCSSGCHSAHHRAPAAAVPPMAVGQRGALAAVVVQVVCSNQQLVAFLHDADLHGASLVVVDVGQLPALASSVVEVFDVADGKAVVVVESGAVVGGVAVVVGVAATVVLAVSVVDAVSVVAQVVAEVFGVAAVVLAVALVVAGVAAAFVAVVVQVAAVAVEWLLRPPHLFAHPQLFRRHLPLPEMVWTAGEAATVGLFFVLVFCFP